MGNGSKSLMRMLIGEMKSAIDEHEVSEGKVKPVNGTQSRFICATPECDGKLSEAARARQRCDPRFKPRVCTECYFKVETRSVGGNSSVPIGMQVSTAAPEQKWPITLAPAIAREAAQTRALRKAMTMPLSIFKIWRHAKTNT